RSGGLPDRRRRDDTGALGGDRLAVVPTFELLREDRLLLDVHAHHAETLLGQRIGALDEDVHVIERGLAVAARSDGLGVAPVEEAQDLDALVGADAEPLEADAPIGGRADGGALVGTRAATAHRQAIAVFLTEAQVRVVDGCLDAGSRRLEGSEGAAAGDLT